MCATSDTAAPLLVDPTRPPPILTLDPYLLWRIFLSLVHTPPQIHRIYPYHTSTIHSLRRASHVCRAFREVILHSPSLWAEVVDLTHLRRTSASQYKPSSSSNSEPNSNIWFDLVLARTGSALLSVTGAIEAAEGLLRILDGHWGRIRKLDVVIYDCRSLNDRRWGVMLRPAMNLESFRVSCARGAPLFLQSLAQYTSSSQYTSLSQYTSSSQYDFDSTDAQAQAPSLFANTAPHLTQFSAPHLDLPTTPGPSWFKYIKVLHVSACFTLFQLLDALENAPVLEWIDIQHGFATSSFPDGGGHSLERFRDNCGREIIHLPHLSQIQLHAPLPLSLTFLSNLRPAAGCSLALCTSDARDPALNSPTPWFDSRFQESLRDVLSRYARGYFDSHQVKELSLDISKTRFQFCGSDAPSSAVDQSYFNVWLSNKTGGYTAEVIAVLLGCFSECRFSSTRELVLEIGEGELVVDGSDGGFKGFVGAVGGIEVLQTSIKALGLLNGLIDPPTLTPTPTSTPKPPLFPSLKTLKIQEINGPPARLQSTLTQFFCWRRGTGVTIEVLELLVYKYGGYGYGYGYGNGNGTATANANADANANVNGGYSGNGYAVDLRFLEEGCPGMEVVWKEAGGVRRYVCGGEELGGLVWSPGCV